MSPAISELSLDKRIAAAFGDGAKSEDVSALIKEAKAASLLCNDTAERARKRALDPVLSVNDVADARRQMEDAAFRCDRLQAAVKRLGERLEEVKAQEENQQRQLVYERVRQERDQLAAELSAIYPALAHKLAELLPRIAANDREVEYINGHALPSGAGAPSRCRIGCAQPRRLWEKLYTNSADHRGAVPSDFRIFGAPPLRMAGVAIVRSGFEH
jgi:hypothetical protein